MEKPAKISAIIKYQKKVLSEKNSDEKKKSTHIINLTFKVYNKSC